MRKIFLRCLLVFPVACGWVACNNSGDKSTLLAVDSIELKKGDVIVCGPPEKEFGTVRFDQSCKGAVKQDFNLAMALLHSFEYDEAEKVFAKIIEEEPRCAMAFWGVAMSNFHPLWSPPSEQELKKGAKALEIARSIKNVSQREADYIGAIGVFYKDYDTVSHGVRCLRYEKAMNDLYSRYRGDKEAAIFYSLALVTAADPSDKTFVRQKKAGEILNTLYPGEPNHPGILHYIIHTYDYPELAHLALPAARKYAGIAPSSAHAQHMPSHIFTRLGLWTECIESNLQATASARCYAENAGIKGHWDEELHGLDYVVYGYLQKGQNKLAREQLDYLKTISTVYPVNFKVAYAFAAMPARYVLENRLWKDAAQLSLYPANLQWNKFPWQKAIFHFARLMGFVHINSIDSAKIELNNLISARDTLLASKDKYSANQVDIQVKTGEAWIAWKEGKIDDALKMMHTAADMEDATEKHPVTPGEVIPARELAGDMLMQCNQPSRALTQYEHDLQRHPKRFNGLYGAGLAAEKSGNIQKAKEYYSQLVTIADSLSSERTELNRARSFLKSGDQH